MFETEDRIPLSFGAEVLRGALAGAVAAGMGCRELLERDVGAGVGSARLWAVTDGTGEGVERWWTVGGAVVGGLLLDDGAERGGTGGTSTLSEEDD